VQWLPKNWARLSCFSVGAVTQSGNSSDDLSPFIADQRIRWSWRAVFLRPTLINGDYALWEEAFVTSKQFVHDANADSRSKTHFRIQCNIHIGECSIARRSCSPFCSSDRDDQRRGNDDGRAELRPVWAALISNNFHDTSIGEH